MNELVKYLIIVAILAGIAMLSAGAEVAQTAGGIMLLWGIAGYTTVEEVEKK